MPWKSDRHHFVSLHPETPISSRYYRIPIHIVHEMQWESFAFHRENMFVIMSAILIFIRSIFDFALGLSFLILEYVDVEYLDCDNGCTFMGNANLFLFLCSIGSYVALLFDLYQSIKNPFSLPKTQNIRFTIGIIVGCALSMSLIVQFSYTFSYRSDLQFCSLGVFSNKENSINPWSLSFIYIPMITACIWAIWVSATVTLRLIKGLPSTFDIRKSVIRNAWLANLVQFIGAINRKMNCF